MKKHLPLLAVAVAAVVTLLTLRAPRNTSEYDLVGFGGLPTLVNGRIKPIDTVARTSLLVLQGRQRVVAPDGRSVAPAEWLLDVLYRPALANKYQTFEIVHPDVLALCNLTPDDGAGKKRFSYDQLAAGIPELDRQSKLADGVDSAVRTSFQRAVVQLRDSVVLYQRLQSSLLAPGTDDFLAQVSRLEQIVPAGQAAAPMFQKQTGTKPADPAAAKTLLELNSSFQAMDSFGYLLPIAPIADKANPFLWKSAGTSLLQSLNQGGKLESVMATYVQLGLAWQSFQPAAFNAAVQAYRAQLDREIPAVMRRCDVEARFNSSQPFYSAMTLYVLVFLLAIFSWLVAPRLLGRTAFWLLVLAFLFATAGILTRMWLEGRPPVTNLYSSALFVGWVAAVLCLVLEALYKNAIGSAAGGLIGFATLLIAHHLALSTGDTMEMMRAVLDSNFWLSTHVVTITVGYGSTFLAGFLALIYVGRGVFTRSLDSATADALQRMVYGIVCFATLFSFVGTVLGGIWADQSWGRFWGWDPKENGALIIVLWNSLILHARWAGLVKARGLMALAIFGNIVTAWSWFGVNMLGVGLHSYGFMNAAFWWLIAFVASQVFAILCALVPSEKWRSLRPAA